jgi:ATP-binding cassette subfamily C (CFTR/MRP) protein 1
LALSLLLLNDLVLDLIDGNTEWLRIISYGASLAASAGLVRLAITEHKRSIRPSSLIVLYLLLTSVWDIFALTYKGLLDDQDTSKGSTAFKLATRLAILTLECQEKTSILKSKYRPQSPEETAGLLSSVLFWWLNGLLSRGYRSILRGTHLPALENRMEAENLRRGILLSWDRRCMFLTSRGLIQILVPVLIRCNSKTRDAFDSSESLVA